MVKNLPKNLENLEIDLYGNSLENKALTILEALLISSNLKSLKF